MGRSTEEGSNDSSPRGGAELESLVAGRMGPSPEHLVADVIIRDSTVCQVLIPHWIQSIPLSLSF